MSWWLRSGARRVLAAAVAGAAMLAATSCGYALAGRGSYLPAHIQTIGVPLFLNQTEVFEVEQRLTDKVRSELIGRGKYRVMPEAVGADAVLLGTIISIGIAPASFTEDRQATRYQVIVTVRIEFRDQVNDTVIWTNPALTFRDEYEVTTAESALDPNAFFGQGSNAVERVAQDFARTVVSAILEAF
jgi:hypothetical protein